MRTMQLSPTRFDTQLMRAGRRARNPAGGLGSHLCGELQTVMAEVDSISRLPATCYMT